LGFWLKAYQHADIIFPSNNVAIHADVTGSVSAGSSSLKLAVSVVNSQGEHQTISLIGGDKDSRFVDVYSAPDAPLQTMKLSSEKQGNDFMVSQILFDKNQMEWIIKINCEVASNLNLKLKEEENTSGETYRYTLVDSKNNRSYILNGTEFGFNVNEGVSEYKVVAQNINTTALAVTTLINYPNPFNPSNAEKSKIEYVLASGSGIEVTVKIYTRYGKKIRTINKTGAGSSDSVDWDGKDDNDVDMPNDVYFYLIDFKDLSGNETKGRGKIVLWKK
jgi:gliding motility-associated-like protein